jgi:hypothetical protein
VEWKLRFSVCGGGEKVMDDCGVEEAVLAVRGNECKRSRWRF